jgi:hypothetical protein
MKVDKVDSESFSLTCAVVILKVLLALKFKFWQEHF